MGVAVGWSMWNYKSSVLGGMLSQVKLVVAIVGGFRGQSGGLIVIDDCMGRVVNDIVDGYASMVVFRGVPRVVMSVEVSCEDIVGVIEKLVEQGSVVLVFDVGCGRSGGNITAGDVKGGSYVVL